MLDHIQNNNIIIVGAGKSGTTLLYYLLKEKLSTSNSRLIFEAKLQQNGCGNIISKQLTGIFLHPEGPLVGELLDANVIDDLISNIVKTFQKRIFLIRDPRDNLISRFFWYHSYKNFKGYAGDFRRSVQLIKQKERSPSSISLKALIDNLKGVDNNFYIKVYEQHKYIYNTAIKYILGKKIWKIIKYEDLLQSNVPHLDEYLGTKLSQQIDLQDFSHVARTRTYDNWRTFLTDEDVEWLKPIYSDSLKELGYNHEDWNLITVKDLNPQFGSLYVEALYCKR